MDDLPGNTRRARTGPPKDQPKVEKVVVGEVILRKKPVSRRILDTFFGGDPNGVMSFVIMDVVVPAVRDVIVEAFSNGIERMVYGESRAPSRRGPYASQSRSNYVQYNRYSSPQRVSGYAREEHRELSRRSRATHNTDEIVFQTRAEAQEVLNRMFDLITEYEQVTVSDLYSMVDITGNYTDESYGWTDIRGTTIVKVRGGYILDLPSAESLKV